MKYVRALICTSSLAVASLEPSLAQTGATGMPPYGSFDPSSFDTINRQNLNVHFALPLVSIPGRGMDFDVAAAYDSLIWQKVHNAWVPTVDETGTPTWGWHIARPAGKTTFAKELVECGDRPPISQHHWGYVFTDNRGTTHSFPLDFYSQTCGGPTGPTAALASDNSGYYLDAASPDAPVVYAADGRRFDAAGNITDRNGNKITHTTISSTQTNWTDTVGHTALKIVKPSVYETDYIYQDTNGADQMIHFYYTQMVVRTAFNCDGVTEFAGNAYLLTGVTLPNGLQYQFFYEPSPNYPNNTTGRIRWVGLPTGGYYAYNYDGGGINCSDAGPTAMTRVMGDMHNPDNPPTWTYTRSGLVTTVTEPQLPYDSSPNVSTYQFDSLTRETLRKVFQGNDTSSTPLLTVTTVYPETSDRTPINQYRTYADGRKAKVATTYDSYGFPTQIQEYDWWQPTAYPLKRQTDITYVRTSGYTSRNILGLQGSVKVSDCSSGTCTTAFYQVATYDSGSLTCISGAAQHDDTTYGCTFSTRGNLTAMTTYSDPGALLGASTRHLTYDSLGNLRMTDIEGTLQQSVAFSMSTQYAYPDSVTRGPSSGPQLTTSTNYNSFTGMVMSSTDENLKTTTVGYDTMKRPLTITRPDGAQTSWSYQESYPFGTTMTTPIDATHSRQTQLAVDGFWRITTTTLKDGSGTAYGSVAQQYDPTGRAYRVSNAYTSSPQYWTETRFDALGRPVKVLPQDWCPVQVPQVCSPVNDHYAAMTYTGVSVVRVDPAGQQRKYDFDGLGRLATVTEPDPSTGLLTWTTAYSYNALDLLASSSQGGQSRMFAYDGLGRLTNRTSPESGTDHFQYNSFAQPTQRTDARGVITSYQYDTLNRPHVVSYDVGSTGVPATPSVTYTYGTDPALNQNGRLITITDGTGTEQYGYDSIGRATSVTKTLFGTAFSIGYHYNASDQTDTITYPSGRQFVQTFDSIGRLSSIQFNGSTYMSSPTYDAAQRLTGCTYGNGIVAGQSFSSVRGQLSDISYNEPSITLPSFSYSYVQPNGGNNGQLTQLTDNVSAGRSAAVVYDSLGRLSSVETTGSTQYPKWRLGYSYDRYGNRLSQSAVIGSPPAMTLSFDTATNHISSVGYQYDSAGNLKAIPGSTIIYDAENRQTNYTASATSTYSYDGHGLRVRKTAPAGSTIYVFAGSKVIAEYANGAAPSAPTFEYVYQGETLLATFAGTAQYHLHDHLSIRATTDATGAVIAESGHYPFGESWYSNGTSGKWSFTSYEHDSESGLDYATARTYAAGLGRFLSRDPLHTVSEDPQSLNASTYVRSDPVNLTDPSGLDPTQTCKMDPFCGGGGALGGYDVWEDDQPECFYWGACGGNESPGTGIVCVPNYSDDGRGEECSYAVSYDDDAKFHDPTPRAGAPRSEERVRYCLRSIVGAKTFDSTLLVSDSIVPQMTGYDITQPHIIFTGLSESAFFSTAGGHHAIHEYSHQFQYWDKVSSVFSPTSILAGELAYLGMAIYGFTDPVYGGNLHDSNPIERAAEFNADIDEDAFNACVNDGGQ